MNAESRGLDTRQAEKESLPVTDHFETRPSTLRGDRRTRPDSRAPDSLSVVWRPFWQGLAPNCRHSRPPGRFAFRHAADAACRHIAPVCLSRRSASLGISRSVVGRPAQQRVRWGNHEGPSSVESRGVVTIQRELEKESEEEQHLEAPLRIKRTRLRYRNLLIFFW